MWANKLERTGKKEEVSHDFCWDSRSEEHSRITSKCFAFQPSTKFLSQHCHNQLFKKKSLSISAQFQHTNQLPSYKGYSTTGHIKKDSFVKKSDFLRVN